MTAMFWMIYNSFWSNLVGKGRKSEKELVREYSRNLFRSGKIENEKGGGKVFLDRMPPPIVAYHTIRKYIGA